MNIKEQIKQDLSNRNHFAFLHMSGHQIDQFRYYANRFLDAKSYLEAERRARQLITFVLYQHEKNTIVGQSLESLNIFELYEDYPYNKQRLHFCHQANVFLLGLYIYHNYPDLQREIEREMVRTTSDINISSPKGPIHWRYSGREPEGEFLYRWRLSSLSHDLGYSISLLGNDEGKIQEYLLNECSTFTYNTINSLSDLWVFKNLDLREQLDQSLPELNINGYMDYQLTHPFKKVVFYDHGLVSALIFLRLVHEEYDRHKNNPITYSNSSRIIWDSHILDTSIQQAAIAIALHNIDQYEEAFKRYSNKDRIFDIQERPLVWLLKISDILQEWDKPQAIENLNQPITPTNIQILFEHKKIVVRNFLKNDEIRKTLMNYTNTIDLFEFV